MNLDSILKHNNLKETVFLRRQLQTFNAINLRPELSIK